MRCKKNKKEDMKSQVQGMAVNGEILYPFLRRVVRGRAQNSDGNRFRTV